MGAGEGGDPGRGVAAPAGGQGRSGGANGFGSRESDLVAGIDGGGERGPGAVRPLTAGADAGRAACRLL